MDEMMETVILDLDLNMPHGNEKPSFLKYSYYPFIQKTFGGNTCNNILSCITGILIIINILSVVNFVLGIGNGII